MFSILPYPREQFKIHIGVDLHTNNKIFIHYNQYDYQIYHGFQLDNNY